MRMRQHMKDYIESGTTAAARSVRILAEYLRAAEAFERLSKQPLVTIFGSARMGEDSEAARLAEDLARRLVARGYGVVTGGSSGVMLFANRGAYEEAKRHGLPVQEYSIGCAVTLPFEEERNEFVGTQTDFHYFFVRKFFLVAYSRAFFFLEGGGGTRDELWEVFCLIQTGKMPIHPLVAVGDAAVWQPLRADLQHMSARGTIGATDTEILRFAPTAAEALAIVERFYARIERIEYEKGRHTIDFYLKDALSHWELNDIDRRFSGRINGLEWDPEARRLSSSQFNFRSYAILYDVVEHLASMRASRGRSHGLQVVS